MPSTALVTGTSSGIGLSTAVLLAEAGFTVVATMRNLEKATPLRERAAAAGVALDVRTLDVQDDASIRACVDGVRDTHGGIGLLVNNAGAGLLGTLEQTSETDVRRVMDVNFFGVWRVTQAVLPTMREAGEGRLISVSSIGGLIGQPFNDAYCAAKFAVEGLMESLAPVVKLLGIHVSVVEPGPVNTEFVASVRKLAEHAPGLQLEAYAPMLKSYLSGTQETFANAGQTGDDIGRVIVEAATADAPHFRYVTSELVQGLASRKYVDTTGDTVIALTGARLPQPTQPTDEPGQPNRHQ